MHWLVIRNCWQIFIRNCQLNNHKSRSSTTLICAIIFTHAICCFLGKCFVKVKLNGPGTWKYGDACVRVCMSCLFRMNSHQLARLSIILSFKATNVHTYVWPIPVTTQKLRLLAVPLPFNKPTPRSYASDLYRGSGLLTTISWLKNGAENDWAKVFALRPKQPCATFCNRLVCD